ncbi:MAG: hypothetical protein U1F60_06185 [Planctomycetota bacterium]
MNHRSRSPVVCGSAIGLVLVAAGCQSGNGSDIGPRFAPLPAASCRAVVLDDQGRGVVGATVAFASGPRGTTGRNGRADLLAAPRSRELVAVDAANGAAVAGDELGGYTVSLAFDGPDLPQVLFVPDLPDAASAVLPTGTQTFTTTIPGAGGAQLVVPNGASIGTAAASTDVALRLGELQPGHLPGELPTEAPSALLFSRGVLVAPADATFAPGADLDVPDDLQAGSGSVRLFRLDPTTGSWGEVAVAAVASGGRLVATGGVTTGGLYAFAVPVAAGSVRGRVLAADLSVVRDVLVRVDQRVARTDADGRFTVDLVPQVLADASPRSANVEWFAGGSWLPVRGSSTAPMAGGDVDAGDLVLDTLQAGNVRVQQVLRGRADDRRPVRLSSQTGDVALFATSDGLGQTIFEDVPAGFLGFQTGRPKGATRALYGQGISFLDGGRRWYDSPQFVQERTWVVGGRRARALVCDEVGGGPIRGASVVQGRVSGEGFVATSGDGGTVFASRDFAGRATASLRQVRGGITRIAAISIEQPNGDHLELVLPRLLRTPVGAFDRHGLVVGSLTSVDGTREHALRATRRLDLQEWWDDVVEGRLARAALPLDVDPALTHGAFQSGVPTAGGHLAAIEFTVAGPVRTLQKVGLLQDLVPEEGRSLARDLPLDLPAGTTTSLPGALTGLDPAIAAGDLRFDLALRQGSGRIVDVARDLAGLTVAGADLQVTLPDPAAAGNGSAWLCLVRGSGSSGGTTSSVAGLFQVPAASGSALPTLPTLLAPVPGATVAANGFPVQFTLPPNTRFATVQLSADAGGESLRWLAYVPPTATEFVFVTLPVDVPMPLIAGRSYTLTLSAYFGDGQLAISAQPYVDVTTYLQSIGAAELGIRQVARRSISVTAN